MRYKNKLLSLSIAIFLTHACGCSIIKISDIHSLNIDQKATSVSGLSAGAYMASQLHITHSKLFMGVGIISGGPFACASGGLNEALNVCMQTKSGIPNLDRSYNILINCIQNTEIDNLNHMTDDKAIFISGAKDSIVSNVVTDAAFSFYKDYLKVGDIKSIRIPEMEHSLSTDDFGSRCSEYKIPFINNCGFDAAGEILKFIYGNLKPPSLKTHGIEKLNDEYIEGFGDVFENIYAYIPNSCREGNLCKIHIFLHGCKQNSNNVGKVLAERSGFNDWAESNDIIIIYPQNVASNSNPYACWDWWGYSGSKFYSKESRQIRGIISILKKIGLSER